MSATADDVMAGVEELGTEMKSQFAALKAENAALGRKVADLEGRLVQEKGHRETVERKLNDLKISGGGMPRAGSGPAIEPGAVVPAQLCEARTGKLIPAFSHGHKMAPLLYPRETAEMPPNAIGRLLRGVVLGGRASDARELEEERKALSINVDPSGGYLTVSGALAARWIDLLRAQLVLSQAGAVTFPMGDGSVAIASITKDPTATWHAENAAIPDSEPAFGQVNLRAKTVVARVPLSLELSQDANNIEGVLERSITAALAGAIDQSGLVGTDLDSAGAPGGIYNLSGRKTVTSVGAPDCWDFVIDAMSELMLANVPMESIGAMIGHPKLWKVMRKLKTGISGDNTPLQAPAEVGRLPKYWPTSNPIDGSTTKAVVGMWSDYLFGVRQQIQVRLLDQALMGSNLQLLLLAYARVDFAATRPASFCTMEGVTVS